MIQSQRSTRCPMNSRLQRLASIQAQPSRPGWRSCPIADGEAPIVRLSTPSRTSPWQASSPSTAQAGPRSDTEQTSTDHLLRAHARRPTSTPRTGSSMIAADRADASIRGRIASRGRARRSSGSPTGGSAEYRESDEIVPDLSLHPCFEPLPNAALALANMRENLENPFRSPEYARFYVAALM